MNDDELMSALMKDTVSMYIGTQANIDVQHSYSTVFCLIVDDKLSGVHSTHQKAKEYLERIGFDKELQELNKTVYFNDSEPNYRYAYIEEWYVD